MTSDDLASLVIAIIPVIITVACLVMYTMLRKQQRTERDDDDR
jgi:hypothetical protein